MDRKLGGPQSWSRQFRVEKIFDPTRTRTPDTLVVQPVTSCYTDYPILAPICETVAKYMSQQQLYD
jgi:hypothetical protein